jgi:hypothetical protein
MDDTTDEDETDVWGDFPETVLYFHGPEPLTVDLRAQVTAHQREEFIKLGLEHSFGILTAQDPRGKTQSADRNAHLAMNLQQELTAARTHYVVVDACSPDHSHCEASVAVLLSQKAMVALACRYDQLAIFWFDGTRFWIVPALANAPPLSLPVPSL